MESVFVKNSSTLGELSIVISAEDYLPAFDKEIKKIAAKAHIKGFRPGKTPVSVIKNMYGQSILAEEISKLLDEALSTYIKENNVEYLGELLPLNENEESLRIEMHSKKPYNFKFQVATPAPFELNFSNVSLKLYQPTINEEDFEKLIKEISESRAKEQDAEAVEEHCVIIGTANWQSDTENADSVLETSNVYLPQNLFKTEKFAEILGKKLNDTFELIPSQDTDLETNDKMFSYAFGIFDENQIQSLKDKSVQITINSIKQRKPRELNAELFKEIFPNDNIETFEQFREKIIDLEERNLEERFNFFNEQLVKDAVTEAHNFELPDEFMKNWLLKQNKGLSQEELEKEYPKASKEIRWSVIQNRVIRDNDIKIEPEEIRMYANNIIINQLQQYGLYNNPEFMKALPNIVNNYLSEDKGKNYKEIYEIIMRKKAVAHITSQISPEKTPIHWKDMETMMSNYYNTAKEENAPENSQASVS